MKTAFKKSAKLKILLYILFVICIQNAYGFSIVGDVSPSSIKIDSKFKGQELLVFGALIAQSNDIIVVLHGPQKNMWVSKKNKIFGVWTNGSKKSFKNVPQLHHVSYTKELKDGENQILRKNFGILSHKDSEFRSALIDKFKKNNLYSINFDAKIINNHLFRCVFKLPSSISKGRYTVEIVALNFDKVVGITSLPLFVNKVGIESWLFDMHYIHPFYYSLLAIFGALFIGWTSSFFFRR